MKISIIVSVYKDVEALDLIVQSLLHQTRIPDEIIISEDGDSELIQAFCSSIKSSRIKHLNQKDLGWRKNVALNRAINASVGDYLIFIDGDCVPYPTFIEEHEKLSQYNSVLCGRRTEPGEYFSQMLRRKEITVENFVKKYVVNYFKLKKDNIRHYEDGIYIASDSLLHKFVRRIRKKENHIVGCNFSCWKTDIEKINGFDEDFNMPTTGEDSDVERRFRHFGVKMSPCRFSANVIHLYHSKVFNKEITKRSEALMETKKNIFICKNGLQSLAIILTFINSCF